MAAAMTPEEVRVRALYLFLACAQAVDKLKDRLVAAMPPQPLAAQLLVERVLRRELGLLVRYWATRRIWDELGAREGDAKALNLLLLRLFTEHLKLPRDGSGLRYAELSTPGDELQELTGRIARALDMDSKPLAVELANGVMPCRDLVGQYTTRALATALPELAAAVKAWAAEPTRSPAGPGAAPGVAET